MSRTTGMVGDSEEEIARCLSCEREKCNNCLASTVSKERERRYHTVPICQYTLDGEFIKEHPSCRAAAREIGTSAQNIIRNVHGKRKSAAGYRWRAAGAEEGGADARG